MADKKITDMTALTAAGSATGDLVPVIDVSVAAASKNKSMTLQELSTAVTTHGALATDAEVTSAVSTHAAVTTSVHGIADTSALATQSDLLAFAPPKWEAIASPASLFAFSQGTGGDPGTFTNAYQRVQTALGQAGSYAEAVFTIVPTDAGQAAQAIIIDPSAWLADVLGASLGAKYFFEGRVEIVDDTTHTGVFFIDRTAYHVRLQTTGAEIGATYTVATDDELYVHISCLIDD